MATQYDKNNIIDDNNNNRGALLTSSSSRSKNNRTIMTSSQQQDYSRETIEGTNTNANNTLTPILPNYIINNQYNGSKEVSVESILDDLVNLVSSMENVMKGLKYLGEEASADITKLSIEADKLTILLDDMLDYPGAQAVIVGTKVPVEIAKGIKGVAKSLKQYEKTINEQLRKFETELFKNETTTKDRKLDAGGKGENSKFGTYSNNNNNNSSSSNNNDNNKKINKSGGGERNNDDNNLNGTPPRSTEKNGRGKSSAMMDESMSSSGGLGFLSGLFTPSVLNNDNTNLDELKSVASYHITYVFETLVAKSSVLRWNESEASVEQRLQESRLADDSMLAGNTKTGCFCFLKRNTTKKASITNNNNNNNRTTNNGITRSSSTATAATTAIATRRRKV